MDGGLGLENQCRLDGAAAAVIGSLIEERRQEAVEGVADCVSGGIGNDARMSEIASCGRDGGVISSEVDRSGFEEKERIVESGLGFCSGCESGGSDFSGVEERMVMAGTVVESEVVSKETEIFENFSVLEDEKDLESSVEVQVHDDEGRMIDCCLNAEVVHQDEVQNVLDSTDQSCDLVEGYYVAKADIVSVADSQSHGIEMLSSFHSGEIASDSNNSSEIHVLSEGDGTRKVCENHEIIEDQTADGSLSNRDGCGSCASQITELQTMMESKSDHIAVLKEGKDRVENCSFSVSGDGITAGSMQKQFAGSDKKGTASSSVNSKQEMTGKEKRTRRKGKGVKKVSETNGNGNFGLRKCSGSKRTYSRKEMEALRRVNVEEQQNMWNKIYLAMGDVVARQLDTMVSSKLQNHGRRNDHRQNFENQKQKGPILRESGSHIVDRNFEGTVSGKVNSEDLKDNFKEPNPLYLACEDQADGARDHCTPAEEYDEDEDDDGSDDEYDSIQRPAFLVEGDPDFESGPPEDGLEYLRRVRWEAKHIPKVKVAEVDICKISNEQSVYMPKIPDIAKCPEHLMARKEWEDAFLADFADLRLTLSQLESSNQQVTSNQQALSINEIESRPSGPELSAILQMDYVSRALMVKNCIRSLESMSTFSRKVCVWLFSLCASIDIPLDADMASYMRALLRKCSSLLAEKTEFDDEVVMLNILVTISGRYFKQLDH